MNAGVREERTRNVIAQTKTGSTAQRRDGRCAPRQRSRGARHQRQRLGRGRGAGNRRTVGQFTTGAERGAVRVLGRRGGGAGGFDRVHRDASTSRRSRTSRCTSTSTCSRHRTRGTSPTTAISPRRPQQECRGCRKARRVSSGCWRPTSRARERPRRTPISTAAPTTTPSRRRASRRADCSPGPRRRSRRSRRSCGAATPNQPFDPNYHKSTDTFEHIDRTALEIQGRGVAYAVGLYAQDEGGRNGVPVRADRTRHAVSDS